MGLIEMQKALAHIYTDEQTRIALYDSPDRLAESFQLTSDEISHLRELSKKELTLFVDSLKFKRLTEVKKLLPFTAQVLGTELKSFFIKFSDQFLPAGVNKHTDDARNFARYLINYHQENSLAPHWLADLISYEEAFLQAALMERRLIIRLFNYSIKEIIKNISTRTFGEINRRPSIAIWIRISNKSILRHYFF